MQKEIDDEYLAARKIVSKIASVTKFPAEDVAAFCDNIEAKIRNNKNKIIPAGKVLVSTALVTKARKRAYDKIDAAEGLVKQTNKFIDEYEDIARKSLGKESLAEERANKAAKKKRMEEKPVVGNVYRGLTRLSTTMHKMIKGWTYYAKNLESEAKRASNKLKEG
jgi:hypothetical protein